MVGTIALMVVLAVGMALLALPRLLNLRAQTEMDQSIKVVEDLRADSSAMQGRSDVNLDAAWQYLSQYN